MNLSINKLTKIFTIILLVSAILTFVGFHDVFRKDALATPFSIVLSQTIWNASKVFFYSLLVLKLITNKSIFVKVIFSITIGLLPFSQYLLSPGGFILSVLMLVMFSLELNNRSQIINIEMKEGKKDHRFSIQKFELLGFFCCFFCSLYNAKASALFFPYWATWINWLNNVLKWPNEASNFVANLYTMGLNIPIPLSLPHANYNGIGLLIFSLIWSVLPFLYVIYFIAL